MAKFLEKENIKGYTFHSCRRSSATAAADSGASPQQMIDFYGWKNCQMPQEYISTSKVAVKNMAHHLMPKSTEEAASANEVQSTESNKFSGNYLSNDERSRLIQNNRQVIFIQSFNGSMNVQ